MQRNTSSRYLQLPLSISVYAYTVGLFWLPHLPFHPVHQHIYTKPFLLVLLIHRYFVSVQTRCAIVQHIHLIFYWDVVLCTLIPIGVVCPWLVLFNTKRPPKGSCVALSKIHYRKSEDNKDDNRKDHQTYTRPGDPIRHRFIWSIVRHQRALPLGNTSSGNTKFSWGWSTGAIQARSPSFKRMFLV